MNTFFADYAKNISKGGTFIRTSKPLDVGTEFVFVLSIPGQADQLQLHGEVMWTVDEDQGDRGAPGRHGHSLSISTTTAERKQLESFVAKLMAEKLGSHVDAEAARQVLRRADLYASAARTYASPWNVDAAILPALRAARPAGTVHRPRRRDSTA